MNEKHDKENSFINLFPTHQKKKTQGSDSNDIYVSSISLIAKKIYWELLGGKPTCICEQRSPTHRNTGHNSNDRERKRERNWSLWRECLSCLHKQTSEFGLNAMHGWNIPSPLKKKFQISYIFFTLILCQNVCEKREIATPPTQISKMVSIICRTMRGGKS